MPKKIRSRDLVGKKVVLDQANEKHERRTLK